MADTVKHFRVVSYAEGERSERDYKGTYEIHASGVLVVNPESGKFQDIYGAVGWVKLTDLTPDDPADTRTVVFR